MAEEAEEAEEAETLVPAVRAVAEAVRQMAVPVEMVVVVGCQVPVDLAVVARLAFMLRALVPTEHLQPLLFWRVTMA